MARAYNDNVILLPHGDIRYSSWSNNTLKILIVGGGGREHALAWRMRKSPQVKALWASPGNPGIAQVATCIAAPTSIAGYADLAQALGIDFTVVGPEAPLVAGIVDEFRARGLRIVGPTQAAARLEGSKIFAKEFFERAGIPTARSRQVASVREALYCLKNFTNPIVIKADGLAAGKGVIIALDRPEAEAAIQKLGPNLVIEEFLEGEEVSFIGLTDGEKLVPFVPAQDHKRAFDGDQGPNTGGMGAYVDSRILTSEQHDIVMDRIMMPTLAQMRKEGASFTGFLYAGLMMTADGPKILEFNVRMGDPETQAIMHNYDGDFARVLNEMADGGRSSPPAPVARGSSVCITLAASGYPDPPRSGDAIYGIAEAEATGAVVFHAGTRVEDGNLVTSGGRVLGVTAAGETLKAAMDNAYFAAGKIQFAGMHYRKDIGQKGLKRWV
jgi:phosphoribosylamine---glycine ligase